MRFCQRVFLGLLLVCGLADADTNAQVTSNILNRVLMIQTTAGQGTAFTVDVDGRQYLVTAKHIVTGLGDEATIQVRKFTKSGALRWMPFTMKIFRCSERVDIAVLIPPEQLTVNFPLDPNKKGLQYGQDVYFLGFPLGMYSKVSTEFQLVYPFSFVKKGVMSGEQDEKDVHVTFLDGYNIFGFSGSPVVFRDTSLGGEVVYKLIGVVSAFKADYGPVLIPQEIQQREASADDIGRGRIIEKDGHWYRLKEAHSGSKVILNTGIVTTYGIEHAVDLIREHPIGPRTADDFRPTVSPDESTR